MKNIIITLGFIFLLSSLQAQKMDTGRTAKTKVVDVLATMPAQKTKEYNVQMADLLSAGEEGVLTMVGMMSDPKDGNNAQVEFAISGLTHYVSDPKLAKERKNIAAAYGKSLNTTKIDYVKAFIIKQIGLIGSNENVATLVPYLNNNALSAPAAQALAAINSPEAQKALLAALSNTSGNIRLHIIDAIGFIQLPAAEEQLLSLAGSNDSKQEKVVLYALSRCGSAKSLPVVSAAAKKVQYKMEPTGKNDAYLNLLQRLYDKGEKSLVDKEAMALWNNCNDTNIESKIAALRLLLMTRNEKAMEMVVAALNDKNKIYRNAALQLATPYANDKACKNIAKKLKKADAQTQADILTWFGTVKKASNLPYILPYVKNKNRMVADAAIHAVTLIGDKSGWDVLVSELQSNDKDQINSVSKALQSAPKECIDKMGALLSSNNALTQIAAMEWLASRKADKYADFIFDATASSNPEIKTTAYKSLKNIVSAKDLNRLSALLEKAEKKDTKLVQNAIIEASKNLPAKDRYNTIYALKEKASANNQPAYYMVLAATGDDKALQYINERFLSGNKAEKNAAFAALLSWKGIKSADVIYSICANPAESAYFDKALDAYVKTISKSSLSNENKLIFLRNAMQLAKTDKQKNTIIKEIGNTRTFLGLMFIGNYLENKALQQTCAQAIKDIALANKSCTGKDVKRLLNRVVEVITGEDSDYDKQAIQKRLTAMPDEDGFVAIFNGKDLTGWKGLVENPIKRSQMKPKALNEAQIKADAEAKNSWIVEDGVLVFTGKGSNLCTQKQYGDFEMYVDWKLDPQGPEPDAGIYLRGAPQVQIWDTARVNVGAQVGSGGLYNNKTYKSTPSKVADNKLGEWNSFYIKMVGERVTVKLNGVTVVNNEIMENYWDRNQPIFPLEQIELQAHGSKVYYRDIFIKEIQRPEPTVLSAEEKKDGFKLLFDGMSMHQWTGNTNVYTAEDGCIVIHPDKRFGGNLYTKDEYGDFVFRFEFQLTPGANNGLGIRTPLTGDPAYVGMELQILDNESPIYKDLKIYQYHGSVYGIIPAKRGYLKPIGEWNVQEVVAKGNRIKVTLNGEVILDGDIKEATVNGNPDHREHPGLFNPKGHIGFLGHGSLVKFRNIRVKELK